MKPVKQTKMRSQGDDHGNCVQAAIASILELELDQVPDFVGVHGGHWLNMFDDWLHEREIQLVILDEKAVFDGYYLAVGTTVRNSRHMVVMQSGNFIHDPHPSDAFLSKITAVYVLVPHNPARMIK